ncbi:hypothetical protein HDU97_010058 [Phlyctochytrium planicorne]|nr:hypothetical protein HDU97_010058 [Phlyctochytrium planicorne]
MEVASAFPSLPTPLEDETEFDDMKDPKPEDYSEGYVYEEDDAEAGDEAAVAAANYTDFDEDNATAVAMADPSDFAVSVPSPPAIDTFPNSHSYPSTSSTSSSFAAATAGGTLNSNNLTEPYEGGFSEIEATEDGIEDSVQPGLEYEEVEENVHKESADFVDESGQDYTVYEAYDEELADNAIPAYVEGEEGMASQVDGEAKDYDKAAESLPAESEPSTHPTIDNEKTLEEDAVDPETYEMGEDVDPSHSYEQELSAEVAENEPSQPDEFKYEEGYVMTYETTGAEQSEEVDPQSEDIEAVPVEYAVEHGENENVVEMVEASVADGNMEAGEAAGVAPPLSCILEFNDNLFWLFSRLDYLESEPSRFTDILFEQHDHSSLFSSDLAYFTAEVKRALDLNVDVSLEFPQLNLTFPEMSDQCRSYSLQRLESFLDGLARSDPSNEFYSEPLKIIVHASKYSFFKQIEYLKSLEGSEYLEHQVEASTDLGDDNNTVAYVNSLEGDYDPEDSRVDDFEVSEGFGEGSYYDEARQGGEGGEGGEIGEGGDGVDVGEGHMFELAEGELVADQASESIMEPMTEPMVEADEFEADARGEKRKILDVEEEEGTAEQEVPSG